MEVDLDADGALVDPKKVLAGEGILLSHLVRQAEEEILREGIGLCILCLEQLPAQRLRGGKGGGKCSLTAIYWFIKGMIFLHNQVL